MALKTRRPTKAISWPLILLAGEAKTGKTYTAAQFTGDERVGRAFWVDLGEGCADEYGAVPGADYEIVDHDGTWVDIIGQVEEVRDVAAEALRKGEKPVLLVIDSMTAEWAMLSAWADMRARRSTNNKKLLADDPDAEIDITSNYWNDATSRHNRLMNILKTFPGIVVMTSLETEKTQFGPGGKPVKGAPKVAKPDGQRRLGADATVWLRLAQDHEPTIVGLRSVKYTIKPGKDKPRPIPDFSLGKLVFELMGVESAQVRDMPVLNADQRVPGEDPAADAAAEQAAQAALTAAKNEVVEAGKPLQWGFEQLAKAFAEQNKGADLRKARIEELHAFRDFLRQCAEPAEEKPAESARPALAPVKEAKAA